jgi:superfamily II RNA helicase
MTPEKIQHLKEVLSIPTKTYQETLMIEYLDKYFTEKGKNVIYTSPIKALSNQKFNEFTLKFPSLNVGIFTGDNKHNPKANVLIMTTEILQNKLLNPSASHLDFDLNELGCVIFDEVHYIDDEERGTVWEQSIILLPKEVQIVMLSATIGDKEQFAGWIERIKEKKVVICSTNNRVVPLSYYQYFTTTQKSLELAKPPFKVLLEQNNDKLINYLTDRNIEQTKRCLSYLSNHTQNLQRNS